MTSNKVFPTVFLRDDSSAFTLVELLAVLAIVVVLVSMAVPRIMSAIQESRYARAIQEIRTYADAIKIYRTEHNGKLPTSWSDFRDSPPPTDPWGNQYVYVNHNTDPKGKWRKDGPVVPINSEFDLYSKGPDGNSQSSILSPASQDDVIYAGDGSFIGKAEDY